MKKILLILFFISSVFGATNQLIRPKLSTETIIDIGYKNPSTVPLTKYQKELISIPSAVREVDKMINQSQRIINGADCETDELNHENCPTNSNQCNAFSDFDKGLATKQNKTLIQNKTKISTTRANALNPNRLDGDIILAPTVGAVDGSTFQIVANKTVYSTISSNPMAMFNDGYQKDGKFTVKIFNYGSGCGGLSLSPVPSSIRTIVAGGSSVSLTGYNGPCSQLISSGNGAYALVEATYNSVPSWLGYQCDDYCLMGKPNDDGFGFWTYSCPTNFLDYDGIVSPTGKCYKNYSYYSYSCDQVNTNIYDQHWTGPVKDTGGDCAGQCGAFGCICNSDTPPDGNCVRGNWACEADPSKLCTRTTESGAAENNILSGFVYENGTSTKNTSSITQDKSCLDTGVYNPATDKCEHNTEYSCLVQGFAYSKDADACIKPLECNGIYNNTTGICETEPEHKCVTGYNYNKTSMKCEKAPFCDYGSYNSLTDKCELKPDGTMCTAPFVFNSSSQLCEKPVVITPKICLPAQGIMNTITGKCDLIPPLSYKCRGYLDGQGNDSTNGKGYSNIVDPGQTSYTGIGEAGRTSVYAVSYGSSPYSNLLTFDMSCRLKVGSSTSLVGIGGSININGVYVGNLSYSYQPPVVTTEPVCPAGFTENPELKICVENDTTTAEDFDKMTSSKNPVCPNGTFDSASKLCKFTATCSDLGVINYTDDKCQLNTTNICTGSQGALITSSVISGSTQSCATNTLTCPNGSWLSSFTIDGISSQQCTTTKTPVCGIGQTFDVNVQKCTSIASCTKGYLSSGTQCKRDYAYFTYACPVGFTGPQEAGMDCLGSCGYNGCLCNAETPPANNCKKPYTLSSVVTTVTKKRPLVMHNVIPDKAGLTPLEYGVSKGYDCGPDCLYNVVKIYGLDNKICFVKRNNEKECFKVDGCSFKGTLGDSNEIIKEITAIDKNTLIAGYSCPIGYVLADNKCIQTTTERVCKIGSTKFNIDKCYDGGHPSTTLESANATCSSIGGYIPDNNLAKIVPSINGQPIWSNFTWYTEGVAPGCGHYPRADYKRAYQDGVIVNKLWNIWCNGIHNQYPVSQYRCITSPTACPTEFTMVNGVCEKKIEDTYKDKGEIISTCKLNGHVGWHSRNQGISSIISDKDRLKFWDSYKDKDLGFIEFVRDVSAADAKENFVPEDIVPYKMNALNFTAIDKYENNTFFVSSSAIESDSCNKFAIDNQLSVADTSTSQGIKDFLKPLSGNRLSSITKEPTCGTGFYYSQGQTCLSNPAESTCVSGKYDPINLSGIPSPSNFITSNGIWDYSKGNNVILSSGIFLINRAPITITLETLGKADLYIDKSIVMTLNKTSRTILYPLASGYHSIDIYGSKDSGYNGLAFSMYDGNKKMSSSIDWCKSNDTISCPTNNYIKIENICLEKKAPTCVSGYYDSTTGLCVTIPKCILVKANSSSTFKTQVNAVKTEERTQGPAVYKCSKLTCEQHQCKTADCPVSYTGTLYPSTIAIPFTDCTAQSCDGFQPYYEYCGREGKCDPTDKSVFEQNNKCYQKYCPNGVMNIKTGLCEKMSCPNGTKEDVSGNCIKIK